MHYDLMKGTRWSWANFFSFYRPQRSWAKVMFLQACVCPRGGGGGLPQCMLGYHPPPPGSRLQNTVYERPVRILLECILVMQVFVAKTLPNNRLAHPILRFAHPPFGKSWILHCQWNIEHSDLVDITTWITPSGTQIRTSSHPYARIFDMP